MWQRNGVPCVHEGVVAWRSAVRSSARPQELVRSVTWWRCWVCGAGASAQRSAKWSQGCCQGGRSGESAVGEVPRSRGGEARRRRERAARVGGRGGAWISAWITHAQKEVPVATHSVRITHNVQYVRLGDPSVHQYFEIFAALSCLSSPSSPWPRSTRSMRQI